MSEAGSIEIIARGACVSSGRLLVCRNRGKGNTFLPGGHIEFGEGARAALERELLEETGLEAKAGRFLGAAEHRFVYRGATVCEMNIVFELRIAGVTAPAPVPCIEGRKLEFLWVPLARLAASAVEPFRLRRDLTCWLRAKGRPERWSSTIEPVARRRGRK
jgi:8-oxo-dGTP pyrophosphatase MutT (NUDIX family)